MADLEKHICSSVFNTGSDVCMHRCSIQSNHYIYYFQLAKLAAKFIYNFQDCSSPLLTITPKKKLFDQQLCAIVVHTATVLMYSGNNSLLSPLYHIAKCSSTIQVIFVFTMYVLMACCFVCSLRICTFLQCHMMNCLKLQT